jgi:type II secretory pathway pseudopilin PulG
MTYPPFAVLKLPVLLVLAALLLAGGGILWGRSQAIDAGAALQQQQSALNQARQQLDHSRQQQQLIATHLADYQALVARGFVGAEDRLAWIEAAQLANRDSGLYGLDYRLLPRTAAPASLAQDLPLGQTSMTLTLPLLVETDLARFLAALKARAPGVYRVQGCSLSRLTGAQAFEAANRPQLQAECELLWFTVAPATGKVR